MIGLYIINLIGGRRYMTPADQHRDTKDVRATEATLGLTRNTFFAGAHGGGFYFVITRPEFQTLELISACIGGLIGAGLWLAAIRRSRDLMGLWNSFLGEIEAQDPDRPTPVFSSPRFLEIENARITSSKVFFAMVTLVGLAWLTFGIKSALSITWLWLAR